jgi:hypothetical protein
VRVEGLELRLQATVLLWFLAGCGRADAPPQQPSLDDLAHEYVVLAVALGERDPDALDFYYGPKEWVAEVRRNPPPLPRIKSAATDAIARLTALSATEPNDRIRQRFLVAQLRAIAARAELLLGVRRAFDEETEAFFGIHLTPVENGSSGAVRKELSRLLTGTGSVAGRYAVFDEKFRIPPERLPAVMERALQGCREQTLAHLKLPPDERVSFEYVDDKPWSGFSRYQGGRHSVIQINAGLGITVDRALGLACHEGYPGHHVFNMLTDEQLVQAGRRWEFAVQPTFSPQSLLSESAATVAADLAFPGMERIRFERDVLFPIAGLNPAEAERHVTVERLLEALQPAVLAIARDYLDGKLEFVRAAAALEDQAGMAHTEATLKYLNEYRTYVVTYTEGKDLVERWLDSRATKQSGSEGRWAAFRELVANPHLFRPQ